MIVRTISVSSTKSVAFLVVIYI